MHVKGWEGLKCMEIRGFVFDDAFRKPVNICTILSAGASVFVCVAFWVAALSAQESTAGFICAALYTLFICFAAVRIVRVSHIINMQYIYDGNSFTNKVGKKVITVQTGEPVCWMQLSSRLAIAKGRMSVSHRVVSAKRIPFVNDPDSGLKNYFYVLESGGVILPNTWDNISHQKIGDGSAS